MTSWVDKVLRPTHRKHRRQSKRPKDRSVSTRSLASNNTTAHRVGRESLFPLTLNFAVAILGRVVQALSELRWRR